MPQDDKSEKARDVNGSGRPWYEVKRYGPLPGVMSKQEYIELIGYGVISDRLKALGWK